MAAFRSQIFLMNPEFLNQFDRRYKGYWFGLDSKNGAQYLALSLKNERALGIRKQLG